jgi:hydroxymethylpyrimidine/phosphomethylpyrimidine kinase
VRPVVLSIAGSDSSGGAGIQADLKAIEANGGYAATAITAVTAQNTHGVTRSATLDLAMIAAQIDAVFDDLEVRAVKSGMLAEERVVRLVARELKRRRPPHYVCDPVMLSKTGFPLLPPAAVDSLRVELLPLATLVTPNVAEAEALCGRSIRTVEQAEAAGRELNAAGARAVLITGGHLEGAPATDVLVEAAGSTLFAGERVDSPHTHGTGCTFAAAVATRLARGHSLQRAIRGAKRFVTLAIRHGLPVGSGTGPTDPFFFLHDEEASGERPFADGRPEEREP